MTLRKKPLENVVGKAENAGKQHFLLFPQCFIPFTKQISNFQSLLLCRLQMLSIWTSLKYCRLLLFYATFNNISFISQQQLTLLMHFLGFTRTSLRKRLSENIMGKGYRLNAINTLDLNDYPIQNPSFQWKQMILLVTNIWQF